MILFVIKNLKYYNKSQSKKDVNCIAYFKT